MLANISGDLTLGATNPAEFSVNLANLIQENKELKSMAESAATKPDLSAFENRIAALEASVKLIPTEARISELVTASVTSSMTAWAGSVDGKKLIGAEASRITMEAMAATGTTPVKPSPAGAGEPPKQEAKTFPQIVQALTANGMIKTKAIETAVANNPKEYQAWCEAGCGTL